MPKDTVAHYIGLADHFIAHWTQVNATRGSNPLTLRHSYGLANLKADRDSLDTGLTGRSGAESQLQILREQRKDALAGLRVRLKQFRNAVLGRMADTDIAAALPLIPPASATQEVWRKALEDMSALWTRIDTTPPTGIVAPLVLGGSYTRAQLTTDFSALKATYTAIATAESTAGTARIRNKAQAATIRKQLIAYRKAVAADFPPGDPLLEALPELG